VCKQTKSGVRIYGIVEGEIDEAKQMSFGKIITGAAIGNDVVERVRVGDFNRWTALRGNNRSCLAGVVGVVVCVCVGCRSGLSLHVLLITGSWFVG